MNNNFIVKDENGIEREATIITSIDVEGKKYLIYSIDRDSEQCNIFVSRLVKDESGNDILVDIDTEEEKQKINNVVKEIIKLPLG